MFFGRSKLESIEMEDDVKPDNAHIARVVIEDDEGEELEIVRHSLPYGDGHGEQGLFFIAYTKDLNIIDQMLEHMFGTAGVIFTIVCCISLQQSMVAIILHHQMNYWL